MAAVTVTKRAVGLCRVSEHPRAPCRQGCPSSDLRGDLQISVKYLLRLVVIQAVGGSLVEL